MKKLKWVLLVIGVLIIFVGAYFAGKMFNKSSVQTSQTSSSSVAKTSSKTNSSTESSSASSSNDSGDKLDYDSITPMQTAAAIAYYGQHEVDKGIWKNIFDGSENLDIYQSDNADHLNVKSRGNSWMLHPSDEGGGHDATYTVGADGEVAFYDVSAVNKDDDKDPYTTVNLHDIINYVNDYGVVNQIKEKAQHIHLQQ